MDETVIAAEGRIVAAVEKRGYADAATQPRQVIVDHADQSLRPTFRIAAGAPVKLGAVEVEGHGRSRIGWVARLAPWKRGQIYRPEALAELERRLRDTGVYNSVSVALAPAPASQAAGGERPVIVSLTDRPKGSIELGASYSTTEGAGVDSSWSLYNRLGRADTLTNMLRIAAIDSRLQSQLSLPNWGRPDQTLKLSAALYRDRTPAYDDVGAGLSVDLTHKFGKTSFLTYGASIDDTDTKEIEFAQLCAGPPRPAAADVGAAGRLLARPLQRPLEPDPRLEAGRPGRAQGGHRRRLHHLFEGVEPGLRLSAARPGRGDGDRRAVAVGGHRRRRHPRRARPGPLLRRRRRLGARLRLPAGRAALPDNTPQGGLSLFETSLEIRRKLTTSWGVAAFIDAGSVGEHVYPDFREPQVGVGVGLRYNLGFGPIRVDIATPLESASRQFGRTALSEHRAELLTQTAAETDRPAPLRPSQRRRRLFGWLAAAAAIALGLIAAAGVVVRYAVLTPAGRSFVTERLDGLPLGPIGRLHVEGLEGDVWRDFRLRRLTIADAQGVWLDARGVRVHWRWPALLARWVQIDSLVADSIQVSRPPVLAPVGGPAGGPGGRSPVSVALDDVRFRLETLPAISVRRGLFQVSGRLDVERGGGLGGALHGESLLHPGDRLDSQFDVGLGQRLLLDAHVHEAEGGAIAGLAGLPVDRAFLLDAHVEGAPDRGVLHLKALSGAASIAEADGAWMAAGGSGQGRVSLAASHWTAAYLREFGPEVRLSGRGRGLGHDVYDLTLQAASDNASLSASGQLDAARRASPNGLKLQASVGDLSRIVAAPAMGHGVVTGVLSGRLADWRLVGTVGVEHLAEGGYALARPAGRPSWTTPRASGA